VTEIGNVTIPRSEWSLGANIIRWMSQRFAQGDVVLEFGSGQTTKIFKDMGFDVYSVEEDEEFVGRYEGVNYIHAPIDPETSWYDLDAILEYDLPQEISFVVVDGPTTSRSYFHEAFDQIMGDRVLGAIVYDDLHRPREMEDFIKFISRRPELAITHAFEIVPSGQILEPEGGNPEARQAGLCAIIMARPEPEAHFTSKEMALVTAGGCRLEYPIRHRNRD